MKTKISSKFITLVLSLFILISCINSCKNQTSEEELELKNKELELKKKELEVEKKELELKNKELEVTKNEFELKQKELSLQNSNSQLPKPKVKNTEFYIINVAATKTESAAKIKVQELKNNGYEADYLWIPDYASLSGAKYFSVFVGPFSTQFECEVATEEYRKNQPDAYGLLVSHENKRVQINGIGKIKN